MGELDVNTQLDAQEDREDRLWMRWWKLRTWFLPYRITLWEPTGEYADPLSWDDYDARTVWKKPRWMETT